MEASSSVGRTTDRGSEGKGVRTRRVHHLRLVIVSGPGSRLTGRTRSGTFGETRIGQDPYSFRSRICHNPETCQERTSFIVTSSRIIGGT